MSLRDKILAIKDIQEEEVSIPEWGCKVLVRGLTGRQRAIFLQNGIDAKGKLDMQKVYPELVILSAYDPESKEPVFGAGDADAVIEKSGAALERIAQVAMKLSGLGPNVVEESEKN